jgi:hypothetical protein
VKHRRGGLALGAALALVLTTVGVAGCGSSSGSSSASSAAATSASTISKSVFLAKANAICVKGNAASKAARTRLGARPSEEQIVSFVRGTEAPAVQAQINQIRALGAPAGDQATIKKMLDLAQQAVGRVKVVPTILTTGEDVFAPFAVIAHPYGLTSCAPNSAPSR